MIKELGLAALVLLSNCKTVLSEPFKEKYGTLMILRQEEKMLYLGFDTDGDKREDLRLAYEITGISEDGIVYLRLKGIADDKDRNGIYEGDELIEVYEERKDLI